MGGMTFLFAFSYFKDAAIEVFKKEVISKNDASSFRSKLMRIFLFDWLICVLGVMGTGILFDVVLDLAHQL
jgi:hypothetical protein